MEKREVMAGWLFLLGSGLLVIDAINENLSEVSLASLLHLSGGLLFFWGSYFAIPKADEPPQDSETENKS